MNLGSLVTVAGMAPPNLLHVVCQNGVYEVTGGQPIPGAERVDFAAMARAAGYRRAEAFADADALGARLPELLAADGPTFVTLFLRPFTWDDPASRRRTADAVAELTAALGTPT
jgi:sulfopyruvate decarboxylase subunit beta